MDFYDNFLDKVRFNPPWPASSEQVRPSFEQKPPRPSSPPLQVLVEPYSYLSKAPGKEVRSALIDAFNVWMNVPEEDLAVVKKVVGMLHTASLL